MTSVIAAIITSAFGLIGIIASNVSSNRKIEHSLTTSQAVTDFKIDELTREVREHNNFAQRIPVLEKEMQVVNHRIKDLEDEQKKYREG